jgi:nucleotide-binding universal stress UspA family protein
MYARIVVGTNGSDESHGALALAGLLAVPSGAAVVVVHAYPGDGPLRDAAEAFAEDERAHAPADARLLAVPGTSPARVLHRVAERERADLLVVGSSRRGTVGRALLGDDARQAIHHAPCAIAVTPRGYEAAPVATIGVGFDGAPDARAALETARELALAFGARLELVAAVAPPFDNSATGEYPYPIDWTGYYEAVQERRRTELDEAVADLARDGLRAAGTVERGWPPEVLEDLSARCDLLVVGSRHWGLVDRLLLGSTTASLLRKARCPMIIVPHVAAAEADAEHAAPAPAIQEA